MTKFLARRLSTPRRTWVRRGIGGLAVAVAGVAGLLGVTTGAANAASGFTVRLDPTSNPFLAVEVAGASNDWGASVDQWSINWGANQAWTFTPTSGGYEIINKQSNQCLTTDNVAGDTVYQFPCVGATTQVWSTSLSPNNLLGYSIKSVSSGLYLDVNGGSGSQGAAIDTWYWNGGYNQYFVATTV
ncbi:RICIN domain-containing protein [Rugosimonospora africana]|uniref:Ricin B lectin domain-containing protein n=1 Tax=Rugosimonospora africana TaxID=556532 RepID=A0A8J3VQL5_9ACTN|nr:RICIN domain-containing protein [Rugosimonospora africana]GIH15249.1 hypothetical protein Raf01_34210 [Rugosimonospora africana]